MAITFPRVPLVSPGAAISSAHLRALARGINERLRSGVGDGNWRIAWYWLQAARQIRNSDSSGYLFPANAEFFEFYQHVKPETGLTWPITGPGDPEGVNVASVLGEFVFGSAGRDLESEAARLTDDQAGGIFLGFAKTASEAWYLGRLQRGAIDPATGAMASPSFRAAREHLRIVNGATSQHGQAYGGFLPTPLFLGSCLDGSGTQDPTPSYEIRFTALRDDLSDIAYPGTCPNVTGDVAWIVYDPDAYIVVLWGGTVDVLPTNLYVEGPYSGGNRLRKTFGGHLPRLVNYFAAQFRGTPGQRFKPSGDYLDNAPDAAFDIQRFLSTQYRLAPSLGTDLGKGNVTDQSGYPSWLIAGPGQYNPGQLLQHEQSGSSSYTPPPGYPIAGWYVEGFGITSAIDLELLHDGTVVDTLHIDPQTTSALAWFDVPLSGSVQIRIAGTIALQSGAAIRAECAALLRYKPRLQDLYLTLRIGGARTALVGGTDGDGAREEQTAAIATGYFDGGLLHPVSGSGGLLAPLAEINTNAVVESFRRFSRSTRILNRQPLIGYAVENGKSVLWFKRYALGLQGATDADMFEGIADAITDTAPVGGYSNQWLIDFQFKVTADADSSPWKADAYSDFWAFHDRCHLAPPTYAPTPPAGASVHFAFGQKLWSIAEAPTGYRYASFISEGKRLNSGATADFFRSCRIYEPPGEIESAVTVIEAGEQIVKITLKGRLHHASTAPSSLSRDVATWNITNLRAEAYRTTENALREYLVNQYVGYRCVRGDVQPGNSAVSSDIWTTYANLGGSCYPHILLTQLIPEPFADGNDSLNATDTPLEHDPFPQAELYLRCMAEGYVDGRTSTTYGCELGIDAVYDYTFEAACLEAFGGRWIGTLGTKPTPQAPASQFRADAPQGHGPLPNTAAYSEIYNQFASLTNTLTDVRIMLPFSFEVRDRSGFTNRIVDDVKTGAGVALDCTAAPSTGGIWRGTPIDSAAGSVLGGYYDSPFAASSVLATWQEAFPSLATCDGTSWVMATYRTDRDYRYKFVDPDAIHALPPTISDMIDTNGRLLAIITTSVESVDSVQPTSDFAEAAKCLGLASWTDGADYLRFTTTIATEDYCSVVPSVGEASAASPVRTSLTVAGNGVAACLSGVTNGQVITPVITDAIILSIPLTNEPYVT